MHNGQADKVKIKKNKNKLGYNLITKYLFIKNLKIYK